MRQLFGFHLIYFLAYGSMLAAGVFAGRVAGGLSLYFGLPEFVTLLLFIAGLIAGGIIGMVCSTWILARTLAKWLDI